MLEKQEGIRIFRGCSSLLESFNFFAQRTFLETNELRNTQMQQQQQQNKKHKKKPNLVFNCYIFLVFQLIDLVHYFDIFDIWFRVIHSQVLQSIQTNDALY